MAGFRRLCLYMPYFPTDRARRDGAACGAPSPGAPQRALVLTRRLGASVVVECLDARAARSGLRAGISLGQAQAMVPELVALPHEPRHDREALRQLADWALHFSPLVEPVEPSTLLIDITGCPPLFGGEASLAQQAVTGLRRQGFSARAAIADTVGAAYALACVEIPAENRCHGTGPGRVVIAPPGQTSACLAPLPPAALRIDAYSSAQLDALGVRTIGAMLRLPRSSLAARFGPQLALRLQQALGEVFEGVAGHVPDEMPHARLGFEQAVDEWAHIQPAADRLLARVFERLRRRNLALRRLDCVLYWARGAQRSAAGEPATLPTVLSIGLSRPSRTLAHVGPLLAQRLEQTDLSRGVCGLMLVARETARWEPGQRELFEPGPPDQEEELGGLIDRLANRLGYHAVLRPQWLADYQPERAYRYVSVAEAEMESRLTHPDRGPNRTHELAGSTVRPSPAERMENPPWPGECGRPGPGLRPVQLFPRPIPIRVIALVPDGPPTWFACRGREYVVVAAEGPERLETAWWRGPDIRRDYFRVTADTGEQFWIFHAFRESCWYLHGVFA